MLLGGSAGESRMLSVVVPVMGNCLYRKRALVAVFDAIQRQSFSDYEVIVVEQYVEEMFWDDVVGGGTAAKYIPVKDSSTSFCLSWCRNVGARAASGSVIVLLDADVVFGDDYFYCIANAFNPSIGHMVGWRRCIYLNEQGSREYLSEFVFRTDQAPQLVQFDVNVGLHGGGGCGGVIVFDRRFYFDFFGGYNENYLKWGREDKDAMYRAMALTGRFNFLGYDVLHLYHPVRRKLRSAEVWYRYAKSNPLEVSSLLVAATLGKTNRRTIVDLSGLEEVGNVR